MTGRSSFLASTLLTLAGLSSASPGPRRVVVMPSGNASAESSAPAFVGGLLAERLVARGWEVADPVGVESILRAARVRRVDSLPGGVRRWLLEETGASAILHATVETWLEGENAIVALSARLLDASGVPVWASVAGATARDLGGALGLRRAAGGREVATAAAEYLTLELPRPGASSPRAERRARPLHAPRPVTFRSEALAGDGPWRVFLVPFLNATSAREAPRQLAAPLELRLRAGGLCDVVEPSELREALLAEKVPSIDQLDAARLRAVAARVGTPYYVRGSVWRWREGSSRASSASPEVEIEIELVDAEAERVLWASHHARLGSDYEGLLMRGEIGSAVVLADQTLAEMVEALRDAKPVGLPRPAAASRRPETPLPVGDSPP